MAELHVNKKTIGELFREMQNKKFIIPDYQRPYKWNIEKCETLWNDIKNFAQTDAKSGADYFLGTIVSFSNKDKNQEIIDGQQRITSFMLLLRSFYKKLEDMQEDEDVIGLKNQLAPCIWDINQISQKVTDKTKIHIISEVATEEDNETFHQILATGETDNDKIDNYSKNYRYFKERCDEFATQNPMQWKELCVTILHKCIILPIECDTQDVALTIFSTLNDRGMPLADSDIFKAQIYKNTQEDKRKDFTNLWKELTQICKEGKVSIDDVFRYYTHVLRARNNDKSKEVGLRKFYAENEYERLEDDNVINEIMQIASFWRYINQEIEPETEFNFVISNETRKYIQCLNFYPNEYWKYAVSVFFIKNKDENDFDEKLRSLSQELIAFLFAQFIEKPSVNAIKDDIYTSCISLYKDNKLDYKYRFNEDFFRQQIGVFSSARISRPFLLLYAYLNSNQKDLIQNNFDIEHIFPKKWQDTNYNGWDKKNAELYLDRFGNKVVIEKKLNIQAGNGYFGNKKSKYSSSKIASVLDLSTYQSNDWTKEDIEQREENFKKIIVTYISQNIRN